jgi:hypothetical protein
VLQHVSIEVHQDQVARTIEFWELLGFAQEQAPEPIAPYVTWLGREGTQIHLIHTDEATVPPLGHAAVVAPDFEESVKRLREADFEVTDARELWGESRAFAVAPAGHKVEVMAAPPPG